MNSGEAVSAHAPGGLPPMMPPRAPLRGSPKPWGERPDVRATRRNGTDAFAPQTGPNRGDDMRNRNSGSRRGASYRTVQLTRRPAVSPQLDKHDALKVKPARLAGWSHRLVQDAVDQLHVFTVDEPLVPACVDTRRHQPDEGDADLLVDHRVESGAQGPRHAVLEECVINRSPLGKCAQHRGGGAAMLGGGVGIRACDEDERRPVLLRNVDGHLAWRVLYLGAQLAVGHHPRICKHARVVRGAIAGHALDRVCRVPGRFTEPPSAVDCLPVDCIPALWIFHVVTLGVHPVGEEVLLLGRVAHVDALHAAVQAAATSGPATVAADHRANL
mmetsp:Transcript_54363/g.140417  ORF Transcript_54363/g.140417 Transcript_54363/m.140417 type:complete len:329 (-) Transcript_54363:735-1721(-)